MKTKKQFSPDANPAIAADMPKNPRKTNLIPSKVADVLSLAKSINAKWANSPTITLVWMTQPNFATLVSSFDANLTARIQVGSNRESQTQTLAQINKRIDAAVTEVKVYIEKKFKKANASANYSKYGIALENKSYKLPKDNDKRLLAIPLMQAAIAADGFGTEEFGTAFWTGILAEFKTALTASNNTAKGISSKVAAKDTDLEKVIKVLNSIIKLIEANYPDTTNEVLREWGFLKQNY